MIISAGLIAGPYIHYKGAPFPKKKVETFTQQTPAESYGMDYEDTTEHPLQAGILGASVPIKPVKSILYFVEKLFTGLWLGLMIWQQSYQKSGLR